MRKSSRRGRGNARPRELHPLRSCRKRRCFDGDNRTAARSRKRQWRTRNASELARHYALETLGKEMAGYSKTPLAQKLGIKADTKVVTLAAPNSYRKWLAPLPDGVSFSDKANRGANFVHLFVRERRKWEKEVKLLR